LGGGLLGRFPFDSWARVPGRASCARGLAAIFACTGDRGAVPLDFGLRSRPGINAVSGHQAASSARALCFLDQCGARRLAIASRRFSYNFASPIPHVIRIDIEHLSQDVCRREKTQSLSSWPRIQFVKHLGNSRWLLLVLASMHFS